MPAEKHPAYKEEFERLDYTLGYVNKSLNNILFEKEKLDEEVSKNFRHFDSSSSDSYIGLMIGTMFQGSMELRLRKLKDAVSKPYFARIDFREENKQGNEKIYIGKLSLMREEDQELIIVDWRAPVANLYYEERLGECSYVCPDGRIGGDLSLKRQFSINEGKLKDIFDIDITTNDEFLQSYLGASADNRLKDIVTTIQAEQNRIIRADMWTPLIVQGAAGSGKTTIALHRIAYLIYTYERTFKPENFMIIAPSKFFLNYISDVLPELGVEKVKQTTFEEFAMELIGRKFKFRDEYEKLTMFVNHRISDEEARRNELVRGASELKASMLFKKAIDRYIETIEKDFIPKEDFKVGPIVLFKYSEINDLFTREYRNLPMTRRVNEIKKHLTNRLKARKGSIIEKLQYNCDRRVVLLKDSMEDNDERRSLIIEAIDNKDDTIRIIEGQSKVAVREYIKRISKLDPYQYYVDFITKEENFDVIMEGMVDREQIEFTRKYSKEILKSSFIEIEDLAPIIYIKYCIYGMDEKIPVKHVVIDEAQDFSAFQLYVLKKIIKDSSFTILGDLCQGIHSYRGTKNWKDIMENAFEDSRIQYLTLEQSYRTTVEIMDAANKVIDKLHDENLVTAKPVIRHGEEVKVLVKNSLKEIAEDIDKKIKALVKENIKSVAVICKTMEECQEIYSYLKKAKYSPYIITGKEKEYKSGIVVLPSYLAKGLEFDAVMIANANGEEYQENELDIKLLYVSMTRPLHRLYIYSEGEPSMLLEGI
ncbi:MAG: helicase [Clostridiales bacterium]|jgi:DNA helicase-2/ATP-dependent DNA helicase PcrA|nr:helicase [Clostridiales bacterium]